MRLASPKGAAHLRLVRDQSEILRREKNRDRKRTTSSTAAGLISRRGVFGISDTPDEHETNNETRVLRGRATWRVHLAIASCSENVGGRFNGIPQRCMSIHTRIVNRMRVDVQSQA